MNRINWAFYLCVCLIALVIPSKCHSDLQLVRSSYKRQKKKTFNGYVSFGLTLTCLLPYPYPNASLPTCFHWPDSFLSFKNNDISFVHCLIWFKYVIKIFQSWLTCWFNCRVWIGLSFSHPKIALALQGLSLPLNLNIC